jgi:hypothetical protein
MGQSNKMHVSDEARVELSNLKLVEFALIGMGLMIATMSVAIFLSM